MLLFNLIENRGYEALAKIKNRFPYDFYALHRYNRFAAKNLFPY